MKNDTFVTYMRLYKEVPESYVKEIIIPQMQVAADVSDLLKKKNQQYIEKSISKQTKR